MRTRRRKLIKNLPGRIQLVDTTAAAVRWVIQKYHYSETAPCAPLNCYWITAGKKPVGAITLGVGSGATRVGVPRRLFGRRIHHRQWRSVERLVLFPRWNGGNIISQTFSLLFRLAALAGWRFLHTVADERAGYGAGYRAANFVPTRQWTSDCFADMTKTKYSALGVVHKVSYQATCARIDRGDIPSGPRTRIMGRIYKRTGEKAFLKMIEKTRGRVLRLKQYEYVRVIDNSLKLLPLSAHLQ